MGASWRGLATGPARVPIRRALSQTDVNGKVTVQPVDPLLEDLIRVHNPLWFLLPRKAGSGPQARITNRSARGSAAWVADTDTATEQESTYGTPTDFPYKTLLYNGKVTRFAQAITRNYISLYAEELESGVQELRDEWEDTLLNGDVAGDAKEFSGIRTLMPAGQKVYMGTDGAPLTLAKVDESLDKCWAKPTFGILSQRTQRQLNSLLQIQQRFVNDTEVDGGFYVPTYNRIPLQWSQFLSDTQTRGANSDCSSIEWINTAKVYAEDLTPLFRVPLARTSSQFDSFDIGIDTVLVVRNGYYISELAGIRPNP